VNEGNGNSIIISRHKLASKILRDGMNSGDLVIDSIGEEDVKFSQRGSYNHRQKGLAYRINRRKRKGLLTPPKRERNLQDVSVPFKIVQFFRQRTRIKTIEYWNKSNKVQLFSKKIKRELLLLRIATKIYHV